LSGNQGFQKKEGFTQARKQQKKKLKPFKPLLSEERREAVEGLCRMLPRCAMLLIMVTAVSGFSCPPVVVGRGGGLRLRGPHPAPPSPRHQAISMVAQSASRRSLLLAAALPLVRSGPASAAQNSAANGPQLVFAQSSSGLQWADAKVGTGSPLTTGATCTIDYVMSTSGARYGSKIYSTKDAEKPYRWVLGDGTTIQGLELAITGDAEVPPMLPGGVRRVIIPQSLGYESLAKPLPGMQFQNCQEGQGRGPIPPELTGAGEGAYQRFKNIYCNANRPYQPDLVLDVKLYGKR